MKIEFTIPATPIGKGRPRVTRNGTYTPQKTRDYETLVQLAFRGSRCEPFKDPRKPLFCFVAAYFPVPKSYTEKEKRELPGTLYTMKPDKDNIEKAILDALNGLAYADDAQIAGGTCIKFYGHTGRSSVVIADDVQEFISAVVEAVK